MKTTLENSWLLAKKRISFHLLNGTNPFIDKGHGLGNSIPPRANHKDIQQKETHGQEDLEFLINLSRPNRKLILVVDPTVEVKML